MILACEEVTWKTLVGFAALILSLGIVRTMAILFSPGDEATGCDVDESRSQRTSSISSQ